MEKKLEYFCINCGEKVNNLFKKYSDTVLKLTECDFCGEIADKYVEYDNVIIIIDLVLFNTRAYRHILFNTEFKHFWKLSLVLVLLEVYSTMTLLNTSQSQCNKTNTEPSLEDFDMNVEDLKFYIFSLNIGISLVYIICILLGSETIFFLGFLCFITMIYCFTWLYYKSFVHDITSKPSFNLVLKTITLASTGKFLQLLSIIWDISVYDSHLHFITFYTALNQLIAYRLICTCPKLWCLITIFSSLFLKGLINDYLNMFFNYIILK